MSWCRNGSVSQYDRRSWGGHFALQVGGLAIRIPVVSETPANSQPTLPLGNLADSDATQTAGSSGEGALALPFVAGQDLGPVRLSNELGRGAMGVVFLARHTLLDRAVAVKFLVQHRCGPADTLPARFVEEAKAAAAVRHAHLTQIYHADIAAGTPYLVMEYVDGPTLGRLLGSAGRMSVDLSVHLLIQVSDAVGKLHEHDLIHRDLKPSNVLIDREGKALVTDFGLTLRRDGEAARGKVQLAGTPAYMAPEMFDGRVSPRSDIYALGITLYWLLAGKAPYEGSLEELEKQHRESALPLAGLDLPEGVADILERACHKQFMFRYKTAQELGRALRALKTDTARAKCELDGLLLNLRGEGDSGSPSAGSSTLAASEPPSTTTYSDTIARAAAAKRERMRTLLPQPIQPAAPTVVPQRQEPPPAPAPVPLAAPVAFDMSATPLLGRSRPPSVTALAILGLVLAPLGLVVFLIGLIDALWGTPAMASAPRWYRTFSLVESILAMPLYAGLLIAAIGALGLRPWARRLLLTYAVAEIVIATISLMVNLLNAPRYAADDLLPTTAPTTQQAIGRHVIEGGIIFCSISIYIVLVTYAVSLLILLNKRKVREAFALSRS